MTFKKENLRETRRTVGEKKERKVTFSSFLKCSVSSAVYEVSYSTLLRQPPFSFHSFGGCCMGLNLGLFTCSYHSASFRPYLGTRSRLDLTHSRLCITHRL